MKNIILLLILMLMISGCYTLIDHPEVEAYYESENSEEFFTEEYDVFVDEDCSTCHNEFLAQKHFSPLIPAHNVNSNWNILPWWLDTKYLIFFSHNDNSTNSESGEKGYQHVNSQKRTQIPAAQQGGYLPASGGGSSSSSSPSASTSSQQPNEGSGLKTRSSVTGQDSGNNSKSTSSTSKRKFRKRK